MNALGLAITLLLSASPCERGADCPAESTCVARSCLEGSGKVRVATLARVAVERPIITPSTPELERRAALWHAMLSTPSIGVAFMRSRDSMNTREHHVASR